ncbi:hypothetical protein K0M31_010107 [Melipona bicolor]|uniref:Uncharacterized protein n=1 Tax=Melipona bicolor TaxID=60889 RepID=A0AA40KIT4_9HYME|nr:hypothetical protein K0M31_010107 [Melipona bicolor]
MIVPGYAVRALHPIVAAPFAEIQAKFLGTRLATEFRDRIGGNPTKCEARFAQRSLARNPSLLILRI